MKKENLGRNIACIVIVILLILVVIIMTYANRNDNKNEIKTQNQTNMIVNETEEDKPGNSSITITPDDQTEAGVR